MESSRMTASNFAHSRARQTLLRQISQEELDHGNQSLLLLVPEKLCSLIMTSKVSLPHIYLIEKQHDASLWTRLSSLTRVSKNFFAHVGWSNCTWFCPVALLCFIASFQTLHPKLHCLACRLWHRSHGEAPGKGANVNQGEFTFGCTKMTLGCIGRPLNALEHLWMHTHATLTFEWLKTTLGCTSKPSPKTALASHGMSYIV